MDNPRWKRRVSGLLLFAAGLALITATFRFVSDRHQPRVAVVILLAAIVFIGIQTFGHGVAMMAGKSGQLFRPWRDY
jgi:uncharacterized protein involved in response to NO